MIDLALHRPTALTKELAVKACPDRGRKVVITSNFLDLYGFSPRARYDRAVLGSGGRGFSLRLQERGVQQVYRRSVARRRSNPFQTQIDLGARAFLDQALPAWTERVHIVMRSGEIVVRPAANHTFHIRRAHQKSILPLAAFVAMSAGVDAYCLERLGFRLSGLVEWRPPEARDLSDLTECGIVTALANVHPRYVFAEDVTQLEMARVLELVHAELPIGCLHLSLPCTEFAAIKGTSLKRRAVENGTSSRDLVYDGLRMVEALKPTSVVVENVPPFLNSAECDLLSLRLRRWGYHVGAQVLDARDFGGYTSRRRCYLVASVFPDFEFPVAGERRTTPIWPEFEGEIAKARDITHCKAVHEGVASGRAIVLKPESLHAATVVRSQARQARDGLYIAHPDGGYRLPTEAMLKKLNGIPDSFDLGGVSPEVATEQIGASICMRLHEAVLSSVKTHLERNRPGVRHLSVAAESRQPQSAAAQLDFAF